MKKNILMVITIMLFGFSNAQLGDLLKQAGNKTKEKIEKKAKKRFLEILQNLNLLKNFLKEIQCFFLKISLQVKDFL